MRKIGAIVFLSLLCTIASNAQFITNGPAIGGVTETSARMYLATGDHSVVTIELSKDSAFGKIIPFLVTTEAKDSFMKVTDLTNLEPNTTYYYRFKKGIHTDTITGHFRTFPEVGAKGSYTFVAGSCQETANMKVFDVIPEYNPWFMLHTGDFTYPDYQIRPNYSADYKTVAYSYRKRYDEKQMKQMLFTVPIDYIYDDNDYVGGNGSRYNKNDFHSTFKGKTRHEFVTDSFPAFWRRNVIKGYTQFFPGYEMVDTSEGIYHSFKFANAEFFFVDRCSARPHPNSYSFKWDEKKKRWKFDPPEDQVLFGKKQMDWLKEGLKNSTADWKFIVSGVPFNMACRKLIDKGMKIQNMHAKGYSGFHMAIGFASYFAGYPAEQNDFMQFLKDNDIKDVIVISGDTHHNVMDDGTNAGLPELNASGLSVDETNLAYYLKLMGQWLFLYNFKKDIWNQGGNGIGNKNFKNAFGKIDIEGDKYVRLSIVDEDNEVISSFEVEHSSIGNEQ